MYAEVFPKTVKTTKHERQIILIAIVTIALLGLAMLTIAVEVLTAQSKTLEERHQQELIQVRSEYETAIIDQQFEIDSLSSHIRTLTSTIEQQEETINELDSKLEEDNELEFALYHKYWYVIRDANPEGGLTMEDIAYADQLCKERDFNPHWMWSVMHTESRYNVHAQNPTNSARGLGQVLASTARSMYERFMGNPARSYNHDMAFDAKTNIAIVVEYMCYLRDNYSTAQEMIYRYRGLEDIPYYNAISSYISTVGSDITVMTYEED